MHIEVNAYRLLQIYQKGFLHQFGFVREINLGRLCTPWPSARTALRKAVIVDHRGGDAVSILLKMADNVSTYRVPTSDSATMITLARISHQPSADRRKVVVI